MAAKFIQIGEPAHDAERQALRFLVEELPESFTVYANAWLVEIERAEHFVLQREALTDAAEKTLSRSSKNTARPKT